MGKHKKYSFLAAAFGAALLIGGVVGADASRAAATAPLQVTNVVLFFDEQSAELTLEAQAIVRSVVKAAERTQAGRIELSAFSAPDEAKQDALLAAHRAAAVAALIERLGFEGDIVAVGGPEPKLAPIGVGDDTLDRRVVLRVSG